MMQKHGRNLVDFQDEENLGFTLLHYAVKIEDQQLSTEVSKFLVQLQNVSSSFIDAKSKNGETALHLISGKTPNFELANFLVMAGASPMAKNALGDTPITIAKRCGHHELALIFQ